MTTPKKSNDAAHSTDATLVIGINAVRTAVRFEPGNVRELWFDQQRHDRRLNELIQLATQAGVLMKAVERVVLDQLTQRANHQGVIAWSSGASARHEHELTAQLDQIECTNQTALLLILDGVTDPHNLGACLRVADGAGVQLIITPKDNAVGLTPAVVKVASGAASTVPLIQVTNLARTLEQLKTRGIWIAGLAADAPVALFNADLRLPLALVLGNEERGLRRLTRSHCDLLVNLPMRGQIESLNVAVTAGICLYETVRQRGLF